MFSRIETASNLMVALAAHEFEDRVTAMALMKD